MDFFLDALEKCGKFPIRDAKGGIKNQIEWLLKIETIIQKIEELGDRDTDLADVAFFERYHQNHCQSFPIQRFRQDEQPTWKKKNQVSSTEGNSQN